MLKHCSCIVVSVFALLGAPHWFQGCEIFVAHDSLQITIFSSHPFEGHQGGPLYTTWCTLETPNRGLIDGHIPSVRDVFQIVAGINTSRMFNRSRDENRKNGQTKRAVRNHVERQAQEMRINDQVPRMLLLTRARSNPRMLDPYI